MTEDKEERGDMEVIRNKRVERKILLRIFGWVALVVSPLIANCQVSSNLSSVNCPLSSDLSSVNCHLSFDLSSAVSISVKQVKDGKSVAAYCPGMALTPASVAKLLPTWFALQEKGADYRFHTYVYTTGEIREGKLTGDIIVQAGGDPTPDSRYFPRHSLVKEVVEAVQKASIQHVQGRLVVEGAREGTEIPGSWPWEDISNYYAALYLPFNYRDNTYTLRFQSGAAGTPAKLLGAEPELPGWQIRNEVKAAAANEDNAWIFGGPYSRELYVKGSIPAHRSLFRVKGAMHAPAACFVNEVKGQLAKKGIDVEGKTVTDTERMELLHLTSPRLEEIVFHTNKSSVNLFAEALGQLVAGEKWPEKVKTLLKQAGVKVSGITLKDACGLSPVDAIPAETLTDLLVYAGKQENGAFVRSLPLAGVDGGLSGYCYASPELKQRLRAKTGSMTGVRCLSGYLTRKDGERLAFTILINHYTCTTAQLQRAVGKFLTTLL